MQVNASVCITNFSKQANFKAIKSGCHRTTQSTAIHTKVDALWISYVLCQDVEGNIMTSVSTNSTIRDEQAIRALIQMLASPHTPTSVLSSRFQWVTPTHLHFDPGKKLLRNFVAEKATGLGNATVLGKKDQFIWYSKDHRKALGELVEYLENE
ncbi:uncharacterized protein [Penaeus vannamei]|uniref:uncharacterized protein n=1 Tax=Penaeus vannamei TaxID=6689 RepID=UPI00387F78B4